MEIATGEYGSERISTVLSKAPWYSESAENLFHVLALLLWAAAALSSGLGDYRGGGGDRRCNLAINGLFSFWQEHEAERAAEALQRSHWPIRSASPGGALGDHPRRGRGSGRHPTLTEGQSVPSGCAAHCC